MDPSSSKLQHRATEATSEQKQTTLHPPGREFSSVDELIRYDAEQNPLPTGLAHRVAASVAGLPKPARSWWRKWFSGA